MVKFEVHGTSFCFVASHLAAHEGGKKMQERNQSVADIMRGANVGTCKSGT